MVKRARPRFDFSTHFRSQLGTQFSSYLNALLNKLTLFGIGASWGGFESLAIPFDCTPVRSATPWLPGGPTVRFHIGLEDACDLIADLEEGLAAFAAEMSGSDAPKAR